MPKPESQADPEEERITENWEKKTNRSLCPFVPLWRLPCGSSSGQSPPVGCWMRLRGAVWWSIHRLAAASHQRSNQWESDDMCELQNTLCFASALWILCRNFLLGTLSVATFRESKSGESVSQQCSWCYNGTSQPVKIQALTARAVTVTPTSFTLLIWKLFIFL